MGPANDRSCEQAHTARVRALLAKAPVHSNELATHFEGRARAREEPGAETQSWPVERGARYREQRGMLLTQWLSNIVESLAGQGDCCERAGSIHELENPRQELHW